MQFKSLAFSITKVLCLLIVPITGSTQDTESAVSLINDELNYRGDKLSFPVNIEVLKLKLDGSGPDDLGSKICIPAGTTLRGMGKSSDDNGLTVRIAPLYGDVIDCNDPSKKIPKNVPLSVSSNVLKQYAPDRYGLTYGALVVPYKYHFSGSKDFTGNSTIGPFLGYRLDRNTVGLGIKVIGFLGASVIPVSRTIDGESQTETLAGFSYGIGLLGEVKNEFQLGVVFGADRVSKSSDYEDNGKFWGAVALGFSFAN